MTIAVATVSDRIAVVRDRIAQACVRADRDLTTVSLIAASKGRTNAEVEAAIDAGVKDIGENRVQALNERMPQITNSTTRWHLLGALQSNKASKIPPGVVVHGLYSIAAAKALNSAAEEAGQPREALVEVNVSGEKSKGGLSPEHLAEYVEFVRTLNHLKINGLMFVAQLVEKAEDVRWMFSRLRVLAEREGLKELSMGMSQDFEVAIEEGATMVRIGRIIFEEE